MSINGPMRPVIYLAGDSTMQSYPEESRPQYGWGEFLAEALSGRKASVTHRELCAFAQERLYEVPGLAVDNCAMAGRSTRSFLAEGRLEDIKSVIKEGDYLLIQFGHNDANEKKPERYVAVTEFGAFLMKFVDAARNAGAVPILVSPIALCRTVFGSGKEELRLMADLLTRYRDVMKELSGLEHIAFVDLHQKSLTMQELLTDEECEAFYREDKVHLKEPGARAYASAAAEEIRLVCGELSVGISV